MKLLEKRYRTGIGTIFEHKDKHEEEVICAFDKHTICSPNCAACEVFSTMPEKAQCLRGPFVIGCLKSPE